MPHGKLNRGSIRANCQTHIQTSFNFSVEYLEARGDAVRRPVDFVEVTPMRKTLTALAAAATIAVVAAPTSADARRGWWGPGMVGGFAAGAIIGSAFARPYYGGYYGYYQPAPVYYDYYAPAPVYYDYVAPQPSYGCWRWRYGYRYRVC
jgi:hypothetical protein